MQLDGSATGRTATSPGGSHSNMRQRPPSLALSLNLRDNALNLLRLVFAALVIVSHSRPLGGFGHDPKIGNVSFGGVAVAGFFAISGYLICGSRLGQRAPSFLARRFLRIFPAYWLCSIVTAFGLAAVMGASHGGWSAAAAAKFVGAGVVMLGWQASVGRVLAGAPDSTFINGSLWTLPYEFAFYVLLSTGLLAGFVRNRLRFWSLAGTVCISALGVLTADSGAGVVFLAAFFAAGVVLRAWHEVVPVSRALALVCVASAVLAFQTPATQILAALPLGYAVLVAGSVAPKSLRRIGATNDVSYGIYLYGWPVQQTLASVGAARLGLPAFTVLALAIATALAWFSWLAVERPVNRWAQRIAPGRGRTPTLAGAG